MRILMVQDEKRIQDFLSRGLESAGNAVDVAANGATAVELVHGAEYDLSILDLMLPDMDGTAVLQKIRNRKSSPPVLSLSARDAVDDHVRSLDQGDGRPARGAPFNPRRIRCAYLLPAHAATSWADDPPQSGVGPRSQFGLSKLLLNTIATTCPLY